MSEIKVSLNQTSQSINAGIAQTSQSIGLNMETGIVNKVYHDTTLKGDGRPDNLLGLSEEILARIDRGGNTFVFEFDASQSEWIINHNLNKKPTVTVVDSADTVMTCAKEYIDMNNVKITFNAPFKGTAYLN